MALTVGLGVVAAPLNGSLVLTTVSSSLNGSDLSDSTLITPTGFIFNPTPPPIAILLTPGVNTGVGVGDYTAVPFLTFGTGGVVDLVNINSYALIFDGDVGAFAASIGQIISQSANFLDVLYTGTFFPGPTGPLAAFDPSPTSVRISLNLSGGSVSYSGTLASPPEEFIPEPGTYALIGAGLLSLFALRRRHA
jgi:hypothetical protein